MVISGRNTFYTVHSKKYLILQLVYNSSLSVKNMKSRERHWGKNECEWTRTVEIRRKTFLAAGETCKAICSLLQASKGQHLSTLGSQQMGVLISAFAVKYTTGGWGGGVGGEGRWWWWRKR